MSIIRDLLEYYRLPAEIKLYRPDFAVKHGLVNGYEERYYYDQGQSFTGIISSPTDYHMVIDMYTYGNPDNVRFRRTYFVYDEDFILKSITTQYEYGTKQKYESYAYGSSNEIIGVSSEETDINVTWTDMPASTGWPQKGYSSGGGGLTWIRVSSNPNPAENLTGYLCDTTGGDFNITLPSTPDEGMIVAFEDVESNFTNANLTIVPGGTSTIMGVSEELVLDENNQGIQLVYDTTNDDWRIVWATPLVPNVVTTVIQS